MPKFESIQEVPDGFQGTALLQALRGTANLGMTTDEIMALTRGEQE